MPANTTQHVLQAWETSLGAMPVETALRLLAALGVDDAPSLNIGSIEALLLRLRVQLFGRSLDPTADCPSCGNRIEWQLQADDLLLPEPARTDELNLELEDYSVRLRMLSGADAVAAAQTHDPAQALLTLLERSVVGAVRNGQTVSACDLPESVREAVAELLSEADPQADVWFDLLCPSCGHAWTAPFDVSAFLACEIDTWARRTLVDVHTLASRYGWSEADILAMSPQRRQLYLEMAPT